MLITSPESVYSLLLVLLPPHSSCSARVIHWIELDIKKIIDEYDRRLLEWIDIYLRIVDLSWDMRVFPRGEEDQGRGQQSFVSLSLTSRSNTTLRIGLAIILKNLKEGEDVEVRWPDNVLEIEPNQVVRAPRLVLHDTVLSPDFCDSNGHIRLGVEIINHGDPISSAGHQFLQ